MKKDDFVALLEEYELSTERVYEDISEVGTVLWRDNEELAVQVICGVDDVPCLSIVVKSSNDFYHRFNATISQFSNLDIRNIVEHAKGNAKILILSATSVDEALTISVGGKEWDFTKAY